MFDWTISLAMLYGVITAKIWDSDFSTLESIFYQTFLLIITTAIYVLIK